MRGRRVRPRLRTVCTARVIGGRRSPRLVPQWAPRPGELKHLGIGRAFRVPDRLFRRRLRTFGVGPLGRMDHAYDPVALLRRGHPRHLLRGRSRGRGTPAERQRIASVIVLAWVVFGLRVAYHNGQFGCNIEWVSAAVESDFGATGTHDTIPEIARSRTSTRPCKSSSGAGACCRPHASGLWPVISRGLPRCCLNSTSSSDRFGPLWRRRARVRI